MENRKPRVNPYQALIEAYEQELLTIDVATCPNVHSQIRIEIRKLREGVIDTIDLLSNKKVKLRAKIDFPVEQYPNVNFPGKVIGPGGKTLKDLQEKTETRMSVLGSGSTRNPAKELELIQTADPKYQHLNERMHLQVDCLSAPFEAYERMSKAIIEIKKIITPDPEELAPPITPFSWNEISFQQQQQQQQSIGRGRGMRGFSQDFSVGNFDMNRRGLRMGRGGRGIFRGPGHNSIPPFNGVPPFGDGYEQNNVMSKMSQAPPRFNVAEPYNMPTVYSEYQ